MGGLTKGYGLSHPPRRGGWKLPKNRYVVNGLPLSATNNFIFAISSHFSEDFFLLTDVLRSHTILITTTSIYILQHCNLSPYFIRFLFRWKNWKFWIACYGPSKNEIIFTLQPRGLALKFFEISPNTPPLCDYWKNESRYFWAPNFPFRPKLYLLYIAGEGKR